jgi:Endonuclease/Exonuclease/phosphatase family
MPKAFSVASWNVEHFNSQGTRSRVDTVVGFIKEQNADVIAIYEVEGSDIWRRLMERLAGYSFFITEGQNTQQILLGVRGDMTAFVTQRVEFKSRDTYMRPGALLTVKHKDEYYPMLFLHVASLRDPRGFGLRADMIDKALKFKDDLDNAAQGRSNYIFLGDLNSMGLEYVYGKEDPPSRLLLRAEATADQEIGRLRYGAGKIGMSLLPKTSDVTWRDARRLKSNLDHVVAAKHLKFTDFGGGSFVDVRGWPTRPPGEQVDWITRFSDHALLYFEVLEN